MRRRSYHPMLISIYSLFSLLLFVLSSPLHAADNNVDKPVLHPAIPLLDESGAHVLDSGMPYSPRSSCGTNGCHNYEQITHAYHFEMGRDEASDDFGKKRGLPQLVSPGYYGGYACMGGSNPEILSKKINETVNDFADKGSAGLVQRCAGCHTGGGWMEYDRNGNRYDEVDPTTVAHLDGDYFNRGTDENNQPTDNDVISQWDWKKSGVVEADCLMCHTDFTNLLKHDISPDDSDPVSQYKTLRGSKLIGEGLFRYADSSMLEFLNINTGDDSSQDKTLLTFDKTEITGGRSFDYDLSLASERPSLSWNADAFDENGKVQIPMLKFPANDNCMMCHRTSNSRRGFYGFGENAVIETDEGDGGTLVDDYQDDVHKGKTWTETNGEVRNIENCNACHSQRYFDPAYANVDLDADHNFPKGNSDMDVRNDLDYSPNAKSCEYCHDEAPNKAIPSGHDSMLSAHREIWKANGDMAGYPKESLTRVTQTHLDVISCQACHITDKKSRGNTIQLSYRYRQAEDGALKIIPYNPRIRAYWKDKNSGYVLNKTERNSVFEATTDDEGNTIGLIKDPKSGEVLAEVGARISHGSLRFSDPETVNGIKALKQAYDTVLAQKGVSNPNTVMVWTESNEYLISHNTRPATSSVQCDACHDRKQSGAFSALIKEDGLLGSTNSREVTTLPHRSLVDDGIVILDLDYMKVQDDGTVTENVSDILYSTKVDPFMTILKASSSKAYEGTMKHHINLDEVMDIIGMSGQAKEKVAEQFGSSGAFLLKPVSGDTTLRKVALMVDGNSNQFSEYRIEMGIADQLIREEASSAGKGILKSTVISLNAKDNSNRAINHFNNDYVLIKLPYEGELSDLAKVTVLTSEDGTNWSAIEPDDLITVQSQTANSDGFLVFRTNHFSYYAAANAPTTETQVVNGSGSSSSGGGGGGGVPGPWLLLLMAVAFVIRTRKDA